MFFMSLWAHIIDNKNIHLEAAHMENPPSNKTKAVKKSVNMDIGVIGKSFFIRSSYTPFQFRKNSGKTSLR